MRQIVSAFVLILLPSLALAAPQAQPPVDPGLWRYVHPEAKVLAGLEWSKFARSEFGRLTQQPLESALRSDFGGLDFAEPVERIRVSSPGGGTGEPRFLVAMRGKFPLAKVREFVLKQGGLSRRHAGVELLEPPPGAKEEVSLALIDAQTILAGDWESLLDAVEGRREPQDERPWLARARELSREHDLWVLVESLDAFPRQAGAQPPFLADVRALEGGLSARNGLQVLLRLSMASPESAASLAGAVMSLGKMAPAQDPMGQLLSRLSAGPDRDTVRIQLALDPKQVQQTVAGIAGSMGTGKRSLADWVSPSPRPGAPAPPVAALAAVRAVHRAPQPEPVVAVKPREPERKVIRIVGLEEGTREIPYREQP